MRQAIKGSTYTFTSHIKLLPLELREDRQELLEESNELRSHVVLIFRIWCPLGESSTDGLFDIENTGEVGPAVLVHDWFSSTDDPAERAILLQETFEGRASRSTVGPENEVV